jgi:thiamine biosynthesis protein ThiI
MYERILVRYGDLTLKGKNKKMFLERVNGLIKHKIKSDKVTYERQHDRLYIVLNGEDYNTVIEGLNKVSGLSSYSLVTKTDADMDSVKKRAVEIVQKELSGKTVTFKVESKRADKTFYLTSQEISKEVAGYVLSHVSHLLVDVHHPELTLNIELRKSGAYLYCKKMKGLGGFPVGVAGKGLLLLSGGIDSPVAGFLSMKQGVEIEAIHFESTPLTSIESVQKVVDLTEKMSVYAPKNHIKIHMVPFAKLHQKLIECVPESYLITIMRRMMFRIAEEIAYQNNCKVLITGESVGQVASQTLQSMAVINDVVNIPVLRPLATYDKLDIIKLSRKINCYDISIRPFEDCCTVYVPKKPATSPNLKKSILYESLFEWEELLKETIEKTTVYDVHVGDHEELALQGFTMSEIFENMIQYEDGK